MRLHYGAICVMMVVYGNVVFPCVSVCAGLLPCAAQCVCVGMQPMMATHYMTHYITQLSAGGCHYILHGCVPKKAM